MKTPTAEEFRISQRVSIEQDLFNSDLHELMIEFAQLHVKAALEAAANNAETKEEAFYGVDEIYYTKIVDRESILNAYPLDNIK